MAKWSELRRIFKNGQTKVQTKNSPLSNGVASGKLSRLKKQNVVKNPNGQMGQFVEQICVFFAMPATSQNKNYIVVWI